jgi:hypothetical protein
MELLVRYLRYTDGRVDDVELTANGVKLTISIDDMKGLVSQYDLFMEQEKARNTPVHKCTDCRYCVQQDEGYSNYTVEGTKCDCLLMLNKNFPVDRFYNEDSALLFASECEMFDEGDGPHLDVDMEEFDKEELDEDVLVLFDAWQIRGSK